MSRFDKISLPSEISNDPLTLDSTVDALLGRSSVSRYGNSEKYHAFRGGVRDILMERAGYKSEVSGDSSMALQRAHIDHTRNERYNHPNNGVVMTVKEHLAHHILFVHNPEFIGLTYTGNVYAILRCFDSCAPVMVARGDWNKKILKYMGLQVNQSDIEEKFDALMEEVMPLIKQTCRIIKDYLLENVYTSQEP